MLTINGKKYKIVNNSKKEQFDDHVIDSAFKKIFKSKTKNMGIHLVYAGGYYVVHEKRIKSLILMAMEKYELKEVMVTRIRMWRDRLITKEKMEKFYIGKEARRISVNDDLETLFEEVQLGKEPADYVATFFLPKLSEEELKLVEQKDENFMLTFEYRMNDVTKAEMAASESDSKFVDGYVGRRTFTINSLKPKVPSSSSLQ